MFRRKKNQIGSITICEYQEPRVICDFLGSQILYGQGFLGVFMENKESFGKLKELYLRLGRDIEEKGTEIAKELTQMGFSPFEIDKSFLSMIKKWEGIKVDKIENYSRRKAIRSLITLPIIEEVYGKRIPEELKSLMICLDAIINATDDLIDTQHIDTSDKVSGAIVIHFGNVLVQKLLLDFVENPSTLRNSTWNKFIDVITLGKLRRAEKLKISAPSFYCYFLNIAHIPYIELQTYETIINESSSEDRIVDISIKNYLWRGRDIDLFWDVPSLWFGIFDKERTEVKKLLRIYRALELLSKDKTDLAYDKYQATKTPITAIDFRYGKSHEYAELVQAIQQNLLTAYNNLSESLNSINAYKIARILKANMNFEK